MEPAHSETGDCRVEPQRASSSRDFLCRIWYLCWNLTHVVGSTDPVGDLNKAAAIVVAEGYATAATLKSLHAEAGDPLGRVAFVAAFDAGNVPHVARVLRERHLSAAMVIATDNDKAMEGQEVGRNPGLIKGQQAAEGAGAVLMAPSFSEEELEAGFSDWNDFSQP
jgi:putative DNA primase/helicase